MLGFFFDRLPHSLHQLKPPFTGLGMGGDVRLIALISPACQDPSGDRASLLRHLTLTFRLTLSPSSTQQSNQHSL